MVRCDMCYPPSGKTIVSSNSTSQRLPADGVLAPVPAAEVVTELDGVFFFCLPLLASGGATAGRAAVTLDV